MPTVNMLYKPRKDLITTREIQELTNEEKFPKLLGNDYTPILGKVLYDAVIERKPKTILEFGTGDGFTTLCMAAALKEIGDQDSIIHTYDYFDQNRPDGIDKYAQQYLLMGGEIQRLGVSEKIEAGFKDFYKWIDTADYIESFDFLYVDVGNTAKTIKLLREKLKNNIDAGATIFFEGGGEGRDAFTGDAGKGYWKRCQNCASLYPLKDELKFEVMADSKPCISKFI
jgi:predicted O-methyltransferase YrrM